MQYTFPNYYKEFSCIAGACPDTCCAGWQIVIDEKTQGKVPSIIKEALAPTENSIDWKDGTFHAVPWPVCILNEENLCDIPYRGGT